jgi:hypothetical protein
VTGRAKELLGTHPRALADDVSLRARPLERLLDLGPRRVRKFGRLMTRLLEEPRAGSLRLSKLLRGVAVRLRQDLARFGPSGVQDLDALSLRFLADPRDLCLAGLQIDLALANLLLGAPDLLRGGLLRVTLDRVRELGRRSDDVKGVHPNGVACRLRGRGTPRRRLEHTKLRLKGRCVAAERVERLLDAGSFVALLGNGKVLDLR